MYLEKIYMLSKRKTVCQLGHYQSANDFMIAYTLGHMIYGCILIISMNQKVLSKSWKEWYPQWSLFFVVTAQNMLYMPT